MKKIFTFLFIAASYCALAQTTITNGGFELWDNVGTGTEEPQQFNSNETGSSTAQLGPQTCFRETASPHGGLYSVRMETKTFIIAVVNGNATTGVVNAPTTTKTDGNVGTVNFSSSADIRKMAFTGRPDSLVGWYKYTSGGTGERAKIRAILHTGDYWDPETPTTYHPACLANKIGDALFLSPASTNQTTWKRFTVPFTYTSAATPTHIMINMTSSANQATTIAGSILWVDDLDVIYNSTGLNENEKEVSVKVYSHDKNLYVDFTNRNEEQSALTVFDLTGKAIYTAKLESNKVNSFDLSHFNQGLYLYQVTGSDYKKSGKVIID